MADRENEIEKTILARVVRLNAKVHGLVTGLIAGTLIFIATNWLVLKGGRQVGPHLSLLGQFFIGYRVTFLGSLIGFAYAFACGYIIGYSIAWMYNRIADMRQSEK